jgi:hypothetical protein
MLVDSSVARSFAVLGWTERLLTVAGRRILVAEGVHNPQTDDPSELRRIRDAIQRQADAAGRGSGFVGRAMAAVHGLDELLALGPEELVVLTLEADEWDMAVRLQSRLPDDREWRRSLGAKSRRLDSGEAASIAIASGRSLAFASDDEDALVLWHALTGEPGRRTRDMFRQLVDQGLVDEREAASAYHLLQTDDLHNLGGPPW